MLIYIGYWTLNIYYYVDGTVITSEFEEQLQNLINVMVTDSEKTTFLTVQCPSLWCSQSHQ